MLIEKISYFNTEDPDTLLSFQNNLCERLSQIKKDSRPVVVVCIGTDRATGDCLGPLVGNYLNDRCHSYYIYGSLSQPIHAANLSQNMHLIHKRHPHPLIIAVDACLGSCNHIGYVTASSMPLIPGQGVKKQLSPVGNISITGIVNSAIHSEIIQTTRLHIVMKLASFIADGISDALNHYMSSFISPYLIRPIRRIPSDMK